MQHSSANEVHETQQMLLTALGRAADCRGRVLLAKSYSRQKRWDDAAAHLQTHLATNSDDMEAQALLTEILQDRKHVEHVRKA